MHNVTAGSSAHTELCGRGLTGQAAPAMFPSQASSVLSFPHKCPSIDSSARQTVQDRCGEGQTDQGRQNGLLWSLSNSWVQQSLMLEMVQLVWCALSYTKSSSVSPLNMHWSSNKDSAEKMLHAHFCSFSRPLLKMLPLGNLADTALLPTFHQPASLISWASNCLEIAGILEEFQVIAVSAVFQS